jgi:ligand-binding sensor domain-containing protein/signal transduction histidine kinase/CheY-like chemotaxis protein/AraC-like DNA-binding protein
MYSCHVRSLLVLFVFALSGIAQHARAQSRELSFQHITIEEGLSQSTVFAITQDATGFMWFGTRDGLNRYDSRKIKTYFHNAQQENSLSNNTVNTLLTDAQGKLWVGTANGLNLYDPNTDGFTIIKTLANDKFSLSNNVITCLLEDHDKNLWVGTHHGLNLLKAGSTSFSFLQFVHSAEEKTSLINDDVRSLFQDSEGNTWVGTSNGLSKVIVGEHDNYTFTSYPVPWMNPTTSKTNDINSIAEDGGGLLIATENSGLLRFDKRTEHFESLRWLSERSSGAEAVRTILSNKQKGEFWIGTIGGLYIADPAQNKFIGMRNIPNAPASITDNSVRSLYADRDGSIWIGTFHGGISIYTPLSGQFRHVAQESELHFKVAGALLNDINNNLWIGTEGNGLFFTDRLNGVTRHFRYQRDDLNTISHNNVKCLLADGDKGIWVGTLKGLNYYDIRKNKFTRFHHQPDNKNSLPDDAIYDLVRDSQDNIWVATYRGGLCKFDPRQKTFETFTYDSNDSTTLSSEAVTSLFIDSKQNLWIGTIAGLNVKAPHENFFKRYRHTAEDTTTISDHYILSIFEDSQNRMWVGTRGNGLNLFLKQSDKFKHVGIQHGLPSNAIYSMQEDQSGYLWVSTENGISRINPSDFSLHNYDRNDGLVCKQFNLNSSCKDQQGNMYFGGYNGVVVFKPESIAENKIVPNLSFVNLKVFNQDIKVDPAQGILKRDLNYTEEITLGYDQNIFSIEFAVLNFINSKKNQFAYKLVGFEERWNTAQEPVATYMNLEPGGYTLLVKGSNNDGLWNGTPIAIKLNITPPPWKTWWAYLIYANLFLTLLYIWSRISKKRMKLEHDLKIEHLENIKQEELHQAKLSFFANIVHEIRTPLTLITSPVDKMLSHYTGDLFAKKELSLVKSNTNRLQRLLNQLLDFHKQETGNMQLKVQEENIVEFIDEIQLSFKEYAQVRRVSLEFYPHESGIDLWFDRDELSKVICNLLVNAFKFTPGGGTISVSIVKESPSAEGDFNVKITIADNGLGIPELHLKKLFHRFYQAEHSGVNESGVGIGLALAKGIIDLHRGSITVDSREATADKTGFTKFTIMLRGGKSHFKPEQIARKEEHENYIHDYKELEQQSSTGEVNKKIIGHAKPLVLLVEDNDEIRAYMRDTLEPYYEITEARNGLEGLEIAVEQLPDLILSDVIMPKMDGLALVDKLKNDLRTSHIPVIMLTARGALNYQLEGFETGADDYLTKPANLPLLLVKIKSHLVIREKLKEKYSRIVTLQPTHLEVENPDDKFLQKLMSVLEENINSAEFNVSKLVREIGMSRPVLFRKTKMLTGLSVIDLIRNVRLKKAEMLLRQKKLSISEVAFTVGFTDPRYFSKSFRNHFGKSPTQYVEELN